MTSASRWYACLGVRSPERPRTRLPSRSPRSGGVQQGSLRYRRQGSSAKSFSRGSPRAISSICTSTVVLSASLHTGVESPVTGEDNASMPGAASGTVRPGPACWPHSIPEKTIANRGIVDRSANGSACEGACASSPVRGVSNEYASISATARRWKERRQHGPSHIAFFCGSHSDLRHVHRQN